MSRKPVLIVLAGVMLALAGCASSGSSSAAAVDSAQAGGSPSYIATAEPSSDVGATPSSDIADTPTASPTAIDDPDCTTHACIAHQLEQGLTGLVALNNSVSTNVKCYVSSVVYHKAADTYSASCVVTYSSGSTASGTGNLIESTGSVTFQPDGT